MSNPATLATVLTEDEADHRHLRAKQAEARGDRADAQRLRIQARNAYRAAEWIQRQEARRLGAPEMETDSNKEAAERAERRANLYARKAEELTGEMVAAGRVFE